METKASQQQTIREYLLGRLPPEQQAQLEERLLASDEVYEELVIVEDELVDEYLREELPASDRKSFESHFIAAPEHQEKLRFARTFGKYVVAEGPKYEVADKRVADVPPMQAIRPSPRWLGFLPIRNPIYGYAMTAAVLLVAVGVTWTVWRNLNSGPRDPGRVLSVVLAPGLSRGDVERSNKLTLPADTGTIRLQLLLPEDRHESYEATLVDAEGRTVTTGRNPRKEPVNGQPAVVIDVAASLVSAGDYRVKLSGQSRDGNSESVASYSFRIQNP